MAHMAQTSVANTPGTTADPPQSREKSSATYKVLYDGQCEICQASISWLKTLDRNHRTTPIPIDPSTLSTLDPRLNLDECLRQLHVITPGGEILVGWDAVASLAQLSPYTWLIGTLGQWFPFRNLGHFLYGIVARNRYSLSKCRGGACRVAKPQAVKRESSLGAFWSCYVTGFLFRAPLVLWSGLRAAVGRTANFFRTHNKRLNLLDGRLTVLFLNALCPMLCRCSSANYSPRLFTTA